MYRHSFLLNFMSVEAKTERASWNGSPLLPGQLFVVFVGSLKGVVRHIYDRGLNLNSSWHPFTRNPKPCKGRL